MKENKKPTAKENEKPAPKADKPPKVYADIFEEAYDKLGEPGNDLEKDTLKYVKPFISEMIAQDIVGKGLTLKDCIKHCFDKGKKFEVKTGNGGVAKITEEQHFTWVREYFGIEGAAVSANEPPKTVPYIDSKSMNVPKVEFDLDSLFD